MRDKSIATALRPTFDHEALKAVTLIDRAARDGRRAEVQYLAHRLAGAAATVHETGIVEAARVLEDLAARPACNPALLFTQVEQVTRLVVRSRIGAAHDQRPVDEPVVGAALVVAIEDDPTNGGLVRRILARLDGIEVVVTDTGREGVRVAIDRSAAVVLVDLNLPDVTGEWVLEALSGVDDPPPVVVVSADGDPARERRARSLGAVAYLRKPYEIANLRAAVCVGLGRLPA